MNQLLITILGVSIANILSWCISQGFIHSYWGKNVREEISRMFNNMTKHITKDK